ncbi:MAG TPA: hypothetical protein VE219_00170, partial [Candidatus Sulfotelmatobacter sp.]|nr:hypothetical protein [Candidatus Sulfotelmatobacter sp.]
MKLRRLSLRVVVPAVALLAVIAFGLLGEHRLSSPLPPATVSLAVPSSLIPLQGQPPAVEVPAQGSLALVADHGGTLASRDAEAIRPIASVAKAMTALAVLDAHPLRLGEEGPQLTLSDSDVAIYRRTVSADGSAVPVVAGEKLTEHQVLLAMLLPSANNLAETLARWVDGDERAFVA